ncbi:vinorine synthase-like [Melia azedarach]|uniref:Vinorine synthase-like n=1 Tax=Melia azedarach TaxID=155640 RepID=A0ACC1WSZ0_MELAZ|nr:vinorine synthase-like [Melia azedarach]
MEFEVISEEYIKPSSPTPHHLKNHKLSFLDLYLPPVFVPLVLYFPLNQDTELSTREIDHIVSERLQLLKQSLSEALSLFYPLAGETEDFLSIDCNDEGVYHVEARVKCSLNEFLDHPDNVLVTEFLPEYTRWGIIREKYITRVKVTTFACGGIAVGAAISHTIADGATFSSFLKSWAAIARKNPEAAILPKFVASSLFPQNDAYTREVCSSVMFATNVKFGKYVTRRFVFDPSAIAKLKAKAKSSTVQNPTRVEAVTALLSKCVMASLKPRSDSDKPILLFQPVNLRRKANPPFSNQDIGNFIWVASTLCKFEEAELDSLVSKWREAIAKLNGDFMKSLQGEHGLVNFLEAIKYERENYTTATDKINFSSWCNLGIYDIDFGWGKPAWATFCGVGASVYSCNVILLQDTKIGNGIEAWVYLREEEMAAVELDKELLEFAVIDPSPLNL